MTKPTQSRAAAACGAIFAIALTLAVGNGGDAYHPVRAVIATVALALFVPFLAYLCGLLRAAEGEGGWLATTALAAGIAGITLKLSSGAPEIAMHRAHVADGTQLHDALDGLAGGATVASLYPFALLCAAVAVLSIRTGVLPRWLGLGAGFTAAALAVNGVFLSTQAVPALLFFILWTLVASVVLYRGVAGGAPRQARRSRSSALPPAIFADTPES
jgi:hypothetical protein